MDDAELARRLAEMSGIAMPDMPQLETVGDDDEEDGLSMGAAGAGVPAVPRAVPPPAGPAGPDPAKLKTWQAIYPCYINVAKKSSEGRRLPKSKLEGCTNPHPFDIANVLHSLGFAQIAVEVSGPI